MPVELIELASEAMVIGADQAGREDKKGCGCMLFFVGLVIIAAILFYYFFS